MFIYTVYSYFYQTFATITLNFAWDCILNIYYNINRMKKNPDTVHTYTLQPGTSCKCIYTECLMSPTLRSHMPRAWCLLHHPAILPFVSLQCRGLRLPSVPKAGGQPATVTLPSQDMACWDTVPALTPWHSSLTALYICLHGTLSAKKLIPQVTVF